MGIDLDTKHKRKSRRTDAKSDDPYMRLLIKLYRFLARRTGSAFNQVVLRRLYHSRTTRMPVSTAKLAENLKVNAKSLSLSLILRLIVWFLFSFAGKEGGNDCRCCWHHY